MQPEIYWIKEFKAVAIMPKPRAGDWLEDEIKGLSLIGVNILVSLLTADEVYELGLKEEHKICHSHDIWDSVKFPTGGNPRSEMSPVGNLIARCGDMIY
jgi:hypothetical protein